MRWPTVERSGHQERALQLSAGRRYLYIVAHHFDIRPDERGWAVFDRFTGQAVVIDGVPQTGMDIQDADELAELLDHPAMSKDRVVRQ